MSTLEKISTFVGMIVCVITYIAMMLYILTIKDDDDDIGNL